MPTRATKFFNFFYNAKFFWIFLVIAVSTIWPRLAYLGNVPQMDEGYYIWQAKYIYESIKLGLPLPDTVTLTFYPLLRSARSWVSLVQDRRLPGCNNSKFFILQNIAKICPQLENGANNRFCFFMRDE